MYGGHEASARPEFIVEDFGDRCGTVCGAGCAFDTNCVLPLTYVFWLTSHTNMVCHPWRGRTRNHILGAGVDVTPAISLWSGRGRWIQPRIPAPLAPQPIFIGSRQADTWISLPFTIGTTALQIVVNGAVETSVHCVVLQHVQAM